VGGSELTFSISTLCALRTTPANSQRSIFILCQQWQKQSIKELFYELSLLRLARNNISSEREKKSGRKKGLEVNFV
jgi:hypothetical protein